MSEFVSEKPTAHLRWNCGTLEQLWEARYVDHAADRMWSETKWRKVSDCAPAPDKRSQDDG